MNESITREEVERKIQGQNLDSGKIIELLFPPKPTFKKGEIIAVRNYNTDRWIYRKFKSMEEEYYCCYIGTVSTRISNYKYARSQTDEEKGK